MKLKKVFAAFMVAVLAMSFLPMVVSASNVPTQLYVGEFNKTTDNLIAKVENEGRVRVKCLNNSEAYYEVTKDEKTGAYILTFYNDYKMSEPVVRGGMVAGLYCNGDLTIRVATTSVSGGSANFDLNKEYDVEIDNNAEYGWYVAGVLTVEGLGAGAVVNVSGNKEFSEDKNGSVGIYAESLLFHDVTINAIGGYAAVSVKDTIAMIDAELHANDDATMKNEKGEPLFTYGTVSENFIQVGGSVVVRGTLRSNTFEVKKEATPGVFDNLVVVYLRNYEFYDKSLLPDSEKDTDVAIKGQWRKNFRLFVNSDLFPACCIQIRQTVTDGKKAIVKILDARNAKFLSRGTCMMEIVLVIGSKSVTMDELKVTCETKWWQNLYYWIVVPFMK